MFFTALAIRRSIIGFTSNLEERLRAHNELAHKGWTIRYRPWTLLYSELTETKQAAMQREKALKSGQGRKFIWGLVEQR